MNEQPSSNGGTAQAPEPTSYLVEGRSYRELVAQRDAYKRIANDLARQLREITPADTNAPAERAADEPKAPIFSKAEHCACAIKDAQRPPDWATVCNRYEEDATWPKHCKHCEHEATCHPAWCACPKGTCVKESNSSVQCRKQPVAAEPPPAPLETLRRVLLEHGIDTGTFNSIVRHWRAAAPQAAAQGAASGIVEYERPEGAIEGGALPPRACPWGDHSTVQSNYCPNCGVAVTKNVTEPGYDEEGGEQGWVDKAKRKADETSACPECDQIRQQAVCEVMICKTCGRSH